MKYILIIALGILLINGCSSSFERRSNSNYLEVSDDASENAANEAAESYTKVVKFYPKTAGNGIIGGSHMRTAASSYPQEVLFITYKLYDSSPDYTYEFIKDGETVHQETADFLSFYAIEDLISDYLETEK